MTNVSSERILAFIPQWEYQCCGDPLHVGTARDLTLTARGGDWTLGSPLAVPVTAIVEHHVVDSPPRHVRARIAELWEVRQRHVERDRVLHPVAGSDEYTSVPVTQRDSDMWKPALGGGDPVGWVVDLAVLAELPERDIPTARTLERACRSTRDCTVFCAC